MPKTIKDYLIGIGYDYDKKGEEAANKGLALLRSRALLLGGALLAAGASVNHIASTFAKNRDSLGKTAQILGVSAENINAIGAAVRHEGGTIDGALSSLASLENLIAGFRAGDASAISEAGKFGIDVTPILEASDAYEGLLRAAEAFEGRSRQQQVQVGRILGLDDATIRLLSQGRDLVRDIVEEESNRRPIPAEYLENAKRYNDEMQDLQENLGRVKDLFGNAFSESIAGRIYSVNTALKENRDLIDELSTEIINAPESMSKAIGDYVAAQQAALGQNFTGAGEWVSAQANSMLRGARDLFSGRTRAASQPAASSPYYDLMSYGYLPYYLPGPPGAQPQGLDLSGVSHVPAPGGVGTSSSSENAAALPQNSTATISDLAGGQKRTIVNNFILDGQIVKRAIVQILDDELDQVREDLQGGMVD